MGIAVFLQHVAGSVDARRTKIFRDVEDIRPPVQGDRQFLGELEYRAIRKVGVRAFVIGVDGDLQLTGPGGHSVCRNTRAIISIAWSAARINRPMLMKPWI